MTKFQRASITPQELDKNVELMFRQWQDPASAVRQFYRETNPVKARREIRDTIVKLMASDEIWLNDIYQVNLRRLDGGIVHLSIKRIDKQPCNDWRHFQEIKNQLVGPECEGVCQAISAAFMISISLRDRSIFMHQPISEGLNHSIMGSMLTRDCGESDRTDFKREALADAIKAQTESKRRERESVLLRAKLIQAENQSSEHEDSTVPPPVTTASP